MKNLLSSLVTGAAAKRLTAVEARPENSNQHEFNGVQALKEIFGEDRRKYPARFVYLGNNEDDVTAAEGFVTWYDAREEHPTRSEFRLYFPETEVSNRMQQGDLALFLKRRDNSILLAFTPPDGTVEHQLLWLFNLPVPETRIQVSDLQENDSDIGFAAREILAQLGIEPEAPPADEESYISVLLDRYGEGFPTTAEFSEFARGLTPDVDPVADPDGALISWLEREEALFRHLERHLVLERLRQGFRDDVDAFIAFSLSVQNRRKSRVGYALEHHIEAILKANDVSYSRGAVTERTSRPDFIFPSVAAYRDPAFASDHLAMLAAKSTCKDRWRQVLAEADRIAVKHLLTIEPGISPAQMREMAARSLKLVVPAALHPTFDSASPNPITVQEFIRTLRGIA